MANTGSGNNVLATSPTLVTPALGAASATSLTATGTITGATLNATGLTANNAVATDGSKNLVSVANTGSGNNVLATSPTLVTPALGAATASSLTATGNISALTLTSTQATGIAPFTVASTTNVANLNASSLNGATFASPGAIGGTTASSVAATTISATGQISQGYTSVSALSSIVIPLPTTTNSANIRISFFTSAAVNVVISGNTLANGTGTNLPVAENIETDLNPTGVNTITFSGVIATSVFGTSWATTEVFINMLSGGGAPRYGYVVRTVYTKNAVGMCLNNAQGYINATAQSLVLTPASGTISGRWNIQSY